MIGHWVSLFVATLILTVGVVDDLRSRKIHNPLVLALAAVALVVAAALGGWSGLAQALISFVLAAGLMLPLFYLRILGGGDIKLMLAAALVMSTLAVAETVIFSVAWGALLGICLAVTHGTFLKLLRSTAQVATRHSVPEDTLHRMPFSVALLLGWLSHVAYGGLL
jgi:prepilin peptidase CpaA